MKQSDADKLISMIHIIGRKSKELTNSLTQLEIQSRNSLMKEIHKTIIGKNEFFHNINIKPRDMCKDENEDKKFIDDIIDITISNINKNPAKKVFYLKKFLDKFEDISEKDKNAIIQSLKSVEMKDLKGDMESLINIFEIKL
jgi:hypothetical protein